MLFRAVSASLLALFGLVGAARANEKPIVMPDPRKYENDRIRVGVTGRNLGNDRHVVAESELGDSQFYLSALPGGGVH